MLRLRLLVFLGTVVLAAPSVARSANFSLERVDNRVQSSGTLSVSANAQAPVPPFSETDQDSQQPTLGETAVNATAAASASLGDAAADIDLQVTADQETARGGTSLAPQADISIGAIGNVVGAGTARGTANWAVGTSEDQLANGPLRATGDFEVLPVPGQPEITNGTLTGILDIIITLGSDGTTANFGNGSLFRVQSGNSFLEGSRNANNDGWVLQGTIQDQSGGSENVLAFFPNNINQVWEVGQPAQVGQQFTVDAQAWNFGGSLNGQQQVVTEAATWSISLSAFFEVEE